MERGAYGSGDVLAGRCRHAGIGAATPTATPRMCCLSSIRSTACAPAGGRRACPVLVFLSLHHTQLCTCTHKHRRWTSHASATCHMPVGSSHPHTHTHSQLQEVDELCEEWEPEPLYPSLPPELRDWKEPVISSPVGSQVRLLSLGRRLISRRARCPRSAAQRSGQPGAAVQGGVPAGSSRGRCMRSAAQWAARCGDATS